MANALMPTLSLGISMRVMQGGHDVPDDRLEARFGRTLANLARAIDRLPVVIVFDNSDLARPFSLEAIYRDGVPMRRAGTA